MARNVRVGTKTCSQFEIPIPKLAHCTVASVRVKLSDSRAHCGYEHVTAEYSSVSTNFNTSTKKDFNEHFGWRIQIKDTILNITRNSLSLPATNLVSVRPSPTCVVARNAQFINMSTFQRPYMESAVRMRGIIYSNVHTLSGEKSFAV